MQVATYATGALTGTKFDSLSYLSSAFWGGLMGTALSEINALSKELTKEVLEQLAFSIPTSALAASSITIAQVASEHIARNGFVPFTEEQLKFMETYAMLNSAGAILGTYMQKFLERVTGTGKRGEFIAEFLTSTMINSALEE